MNHIIKLTVQGMGFILSQFSTSENKFLWVCTPDYSRQIYIGPAYEKIFGRSCAELYKNPGAWRESLAKIENDSITQLLKSRVPQGFNSLSTAFYRIYDTTKRMHWIKDTCFYLFNFSGRQVATAGIVEDVTEAQWEKEIFNRHNHDDPENFSNCELSTLFSKELKLSFNELNLFGPKDNVINNFEEKESIKIVLTSTGEIIKLTQREAECLFHLSNGQTGKIIARMLSISPRTVEAHLDNIKKKLNCNTRVELMSKFCAIVM